jgi:hypothetical protein
MAPLADSVVQVLAAASGSTRAAATPTVKRENAKRKAVASPDASPDLQHAVKRPTTTVKQEDTARLYMYRPQPSQNNAALKGWTRDEQNCKLAPHYPSFDKG